MSIKGYEGWTKNHRKFMTWEWYTTPYMYHLFSHLIMSANHKDGKSRGRDVKRGQLITGLHKLQSETGIPIQSLRTCLSRLEKTGEINKQSTSKYTKITICNYDSYQSDQQTKPEEPTNDQQSANKVPTTNNNDNNNKEDNKEEIINPESNDSGSLTTSLFPNDAGKGNDVRPPEKPSKPKAHPAYQPIVDFWLKEFHHGWVFDGKHGKKVKSLIGKLENKIKVTGEEATKEKVVSEFKDMCLQLPTWYQNKDLDVLDSKFNEIISEIQITKLKNGTKTINQREYPGNSKYRRRN